MALRTREQSLGLHCGIDATRLVRASHLVSARTGITVPPNKAVVGANAFAHEAGIHQDGVIKYRETYEIMSPEAVGLTQSRLVLGKHSGRRALRQRLEELGYDSLSEDFLNDIFQRFKQLADKKKEITEAELEALVDDTVGRPVDTYVLKGVHVSCGAPSIPTASVSLQVADGEQVTRAATGNGPVDAIFTAINRILHIEVDLLEYAVHAVSGGVETLGEVTVQIRSAGHPSRSFRGHAANTDILVASAQAYVGAVNKLISVTQGVQRPAAAEVSS
jgi:2-isopropylmalate synthase